MLFVGIQAGIVEREYGAMALSLPRCPPPEPLHQLAGIRERKLSTHRLRRSTRAIHDSTETSSMQLASTDHMKIPSTEPCCKISPLVIVPRKSARRSSRLRAKKSRGDVEVDSADIEAAEWVSRTLANNGVVEIDPLTITEQIRLAQKTGSTNAQNPVASLTTSSEVPNYFSPTGGLPKVPFGVALAAGSAVILAAVAVLVRILNTQGAAAGAGVVSNQTDSEGNRLRSSLAGEPLNEDFASDQSSKGSSAPALMKDKRLAADVLASAAGLSPGAAILTPYDLQPGTVKAGLNRSSMPLPPTLSKAGLRSQTSGRNQQGETSTRDSATPFFSSDSSNVASSTPTSSVSRWLEGKYKSVSPFFPSDRVAAVTSYENASSSESVTPSFPDEQGSVPRYESLVENVPPFFPDEQGSEHRDRSLENATSFFPDEQGRHSDSGPSWEAVTPFFPDDQISKRQNGSSLDTVTPFFADEQGRDSAGASQLNTSFKYENVIPFFPDDRVERLGPSQSGEQFGRWNGGSSGELRIFLTEAEEERVNGQYQALQAAFPVVAIGAGALGALAGGHVRIFQHT
nr:uncharacterized protein LOC112287751 isoform X2 [Physcomitrium patens]|eukprot:XP_024386874.1 uncharacterized protein LOC112287751 isoform X2 [Physcomitrella patens]